MRAASEKTYLSKRMLSQYQEQKALRMQQKLQPIAEKKFAEDEELKEEQEEQV